MGSRWELRYRWQKCRWVTWIYSNWTTDTELRDSWTRPYKGRGIGVVLSRKKPIVGVVGTLGKSAVTSNDTRIEPWGGWTSMILSRSSRKFLTENWDLWSTIEINQLSRFGQVISWGREEWGHRSDGDISFVNPRKTVEMTGFRVRVEEPIGVLDQVVLFRTADTSSWTWVWKSKSEFTLATVHFLPFKKSITFLEYLECSKRTTQ